MSNDDDPMKRWGPVIAAVGLMLTGSGAQYGLTWAGVADPSGAQEMVNESSSAMAQVIDVYERQIDDLMDQRDRDRARIEVLRDEVRGCLWTDEPTSDFVDELDTESTHSE